MEKRHSVRSYKETGLNIQIKNEWNDFILECNRKSGLHIQLATDEPKAFDSMMAHYGKFSGVKNYVAIIGAKSSDLEEKCGYYGKKSYWKRSKWTDAVRKFPYFSFPYIIVMTAFPINSVHFWPFDRTISAWRPNKGTSRSKTAHSQ